MRLFVWTTCRCGKLRNADSKAQLIVSPITLTSIACSRIVHRERTNLLHDIQISREKGHVHDLQWTPFNLQLRVRGRHRLVAHIHGYLTELSATCGIVSIGYSKRDNVVTAYIDVSNPFFLLSKPSWDWLPVTIDRFVLLVGTRREWRHKVLALVSTNQKVFSWSTRNQHDSPSQT